MNEHAEKLLEVADRSGQPKAGVVYVQDDNDYPVDPLDKPDYTPAPGKGATQNRQGVEGN